MTKATEVLKVHTAEELAANLLKINGIVVSLLTAKRLVNVINAYNKERSYVPSLKGSLQPTFQGIDALVSIIYTCQQEKREHGLFGLPGVTRGAISAYKWWINKHSNVQRAEAIKRIKYLIRQISTEEPTGSKIAPHLAKCTAELDAILKLIGK